MRTTVYIPANRYHWMRQKVSKDWAAAVQTIHCKVVAYLADHPMPAYAECWRELNMEPRHFTIPLAQEVEDYFTELGRGDFRLGFFIAIEVYRFSVDPDGAVRGWAIWEAFHPELRVRKLELA